MVFRMGRTDVTSEADATVSSDESQIATLDAHRNSLIVSRMQSEAAGLSSKEFVALMGFHTVGFMGEGKKGPMSRWTQNPYVFDNDYFKELLRGNESRYFQSENDRRLVQSPELREWVE